jgi:transcriptional regulator with XRE-family HTH domain
MMSTQMLVEVDGHKLRRLRKQRVLLIADLARESGVHRNIISKLESGKGGAYPETIRKLAKALGVEARELVKAEE